MDLLTLSIVSHGHGALLTDLLDDLVRCGAHRHGPVIVTLNKADESFDASRWPALTIKVLRNVRPRGFGANHNAAFKHCHTRWFAVLNPDLRLPSDPFEPLLREAADIPTIGVIAPRIVDPHGRFEDSVRENLTPVSLLKRKLHSQAGRAEIQAGKSSSAFFWLAGMFLVFSADAYRRIQGFDERFFLYCEDYDVCARLHRAGYQLRVAPEVAAVHHAQRDSRRLLSRHLRLHLASLLRVWTSSAFWWVLLSGGKARSSPHSP
jgi:N-acetylglucosaminyl-diphospho-decaprenol L-rhamnosyltransferase